MTYQPFTAGKWQTTLRSFGMVGMNVTVAGRTVAYLFDECDIYWLLLTERPDLKAEQILTALNGW